jgi:hypothetical protein
MSMHMERDQLKKAYPSRKWADKVDDMSSEQVVAIYIRLKSQGKLGR